MCEMKVAKTQVGPYRARQTTVNRLPGAESSCWLSSAASSSVRWGCCQSSASVGGKAHLVANQGRSGFISHYSCGCQSLRSQRLGLVAALSWLLICRGQLGFPSASCTSLPWIFTPIESFIWICCSIFSKNGPVSWQQVQSNDYYSWLLKLIEWLVV